jgi:hypothetical protein
MPWIVVLAKISNDGIDALAKFGKEANGIAVMSLILEFH